MLRQDINELLTQTGPGTPMGELFALIREISGAIQHEIGAFG